MDSIEGIPSTFLNAHYFHISGGSWRCFLDNLIHVVDRPIKIIHTQMLSASTSCVPSFWGRLSLVKPMGVVNPRFHFSAVRNWGCTFILTHRISVYQEKFYEKQIWFHYNSETSISQRCVCNYTPIEWNCTERAQTRGGIGVILLPTK